MIRAGASPQLAPKPAAQCVYGDEVRLELAVGVEEQSAEPGHEAGGTSRVGAQEDTSAVVVIGVQVVPDDGTTTQDTLHLLQQRGRELLRHHLGAWSTRARARVELAGSTVRRAHSHRGHAHTWAPSMETRSSHPAHPPWPEAEQTLTAPQPDPPLARTGLRTPVPTGTAMRPLAGSSPGTEPVAAALRMPRNRRGPVGHSPVQITPIPGSSSWPMVSK